MGGRPRLARFYAKRTNSSKGNQTKWKLPISQNATVCAFVGIRAATRSSPGSSAICTNTVRTSLELPSKIRLVARAARVVDAKSGKVVRTIDLGGQPEFPVTDGGRPRLRESGKYQRSDRD